MGKRKEILFFAAAVGWGMLVLAFVVYLFFPYQKALKIALQNVSGGGRTAVSMEGVTMKPMGVKASRLLFRPDGSTGQRVPIELSKIDISWNPLPLIAGKATIYSKAALYGGTLRCAVEDVPVMAASNPRVSLRLEHVDIGKCPEGVLPWFKGMTGTLDGVIREETPVGRPDKQIGSFRLSLKGGEVRGLQIRNMPRVIIPYKEIVVEGKIDGSRLDIRRLDLTSDVIHLSGSGVLESGEVEHTIDLRLSYEVLSRAFPMQGKGMITVTGSQSAPAVAIAPDAQKPADGMKGERVN